MTLTNDRCRTWCSLVVCALCGELASRRHDGLYRCADHLDGPTVAVWREDCPHQPGADGDVNKLRRMLQSAADRCATAEAELDNLRDQVTQSELFTTGAWTDNPDEPIAVIEAKLELRNLFTIDGQAGDVPSAKTQAEVAHLALRHHLEKAGQVIQDMCPYVDITGGTRYGFKGEPVADEVPEEMPEDQDA